MPEWLNAWFFTLRRKVGFGGIALALVLAFTVFRPAGMPGPLERDFEAYYAAGVTVDNGGDPYSRAIWAAEARIPGVISTRDELLPFVGPAAALPFWAALARLPYHAALVVWTAILFGAFCVVLVCALRLTRARRDPRVYAGAATFALAAAPLIGDLALGQAALVSAAAVAAAAVAYQSRSAPAAFLATLVSALQPNLAFGLLGRLRTRWDVGIAAAAGATFLGATLAAGGGLNGLAAYLRRLSAHGAAERFITIQHTPAAIAFAWGAAPPMASAIGSAIGLLTIAATIVVVIRERLDATTATLVCCATLPLAIPFFHEHDFVLEMFPLLVLALRASGRARILAAVASMLILVDWFGLAQRPSAQGQIVCLGAAVAFSFIVLNRARLLDRFDFAGLTTLAALAAIAIPLGHAHPAPTWPDGLSTVYRAPATPDVSRVWGDEQRAAGLLAVEPAWGTLRSLPLAGSILLASALVIEARGRKRRRGTVVAGDLTIARPLVRV